VDVVVNLPLEVPLVLEGTRVTLVVAGSGGEGRASGLERKMKDVAMEVIMSDKDSPGLERSRMYHNAGLTRASVSVS